MVDGVSQKAYLSCLWGATDTGIESRRYRQGVLGSPKSRQAIDETGKYSKHPDDTGAIDGLFTICWAPYFGLGLCMKLLPSQTGESSLLAIGEEARALLMRHDFAGLANRFGYALAYDRLPSAAIEADFMSAVASPITVASGAYLPVAVTVKYFSPNDTALFAVVECPVPVAEGAAAVLLELVITGKGEEKHITVEDITGVPA